MPFNPEWISPLRLPFNLADQHLQQTHGKQKHNPNFFGSRDPQTPNRSRRKDQNDQVRRNVEQTCDEKTYVVIETFSVLDQGVPIRFPWSTGEDGDGSGDDEINPRDNNNDPGRVPHEGVHDSGGSK